ncbi:MAG: helix-turn-helix transcriptional regulator [Deltaproteobacteria bacterium]|nr:helix-turn-helix transcriptional regulator [Deltaproteobacteria bacterium]MBM4283856.1 helix-turn-helix transcriptional regulator [Deltaproteobacteria bacterium]
MMRRPGPPPWEVFRGSMLAQIRRQQGLTQREMAKALGLASRETFSAYERGYIAPSLATFQGMCRVLNLDPVTLAAILKLPFLPNQEMERFYRACRQTALTPGEALRQLVRSFVRVVEENAQGNG